VAEREADDNTGFNVAPLRYSRHGRETIDRIRDQLGDAGFVAYCRGQVLKYTDRAGLKGDEAEDLKKAEFYGQMADHVERPAEVKDPRAYRKAFEPYVRQEQ